MSAALVERGRRVLRLEREALAEVENRLGDDFARAVGILAASQGRVIISGVGKSGIIGRKIAATLTSTGTPAMFLHPVESLHGDLGIVGTADVAMLLSKSGETEEMMPLLQELKRLGVSVIALVGERDSTLGRQADVVLDAWVREEACPHDLAPTTSTTAMLALGDALAVTLLEEKGFRAEDFARLHPGGSLGRRLLRVRDVMVTDALPVLPPDATMRDAIMPIAERRGTVAIIDGDRRVLGVITAGDLSRLMERDGEGFHRVSVQEVMVRTPKVVHEHELASAAVYLMEKHRVMALPVLDGDEHMVGMVHLHDLMRARVV